MTYAIGADKRDEAVHASGAADGAAGQRLERADAAHDRRVLQQRELGGILDREGLET